MPLSHPDATPPPVRRAAPHVCMRPLAVALAAALISLAVSAVFIIRRPDRSVGAAFLFSDEAMNLFVADALARGQRLYTEVAYPYGPVPAHVYAWIARAFGNTPHVYLGAMALLSAVSVALVAVLIRRSAGQLTSLAIVVVGLVPTMPAPGASIGGYTASLYMPLERIVLLAAVLLWRPASFRGAWHSISIGAILGLCQGVRFGSAAVLVAAIVLLDLLAPAAGAETGATRARASAWIVAGFLIGEAAWSIWAMATLPRAYALEFLWPLQMLETHRTSGAPRWPTWHGWRMTSTQYLMPVTAALVSLTAAVGWMRSRPARATRGADQESASILTFVFFVLASLVYFRHEHHFRQFAWMLVPAAAGPVARLSAAPRAILLVLCAPSLWPLASALIHRVPPDVVRYEVPRGYVLSLAPDMAARVRFLEMQAPPGPILFVPNGVGWLYAYDVDHVSRHVWFYSRAVIRPFEEESFARDAARAAAVIRCGGAGGALSWPFPAAAAAYVEQHFSRAVSGAACVIRTPPDAPAAVRR